MESTIDPLVVIVGETCSGKSALALRLAELFNGEIIAADSWTVYRGFNIGTAKPSRTDQQSVPHHLLDIVNAPDGFNAALYKDLAMAAIIDIQSMGKLPILVGGTGLYIDSVLYDYGFLKGADADKRQTLNDQTLQELLKLAQTKSIDLTGIDFRNKRRVIRAIENNGQKPTKAAMRPDTLVAGLKIDKVMLKERVIDRVDKMIGEGLETEVARLAGSYGWGVEPMKGIGYREWHEYFTGSQSLEQTRLQIIAATMNLAKRQRTWFKRNDRIQWFEDPSEIVSLVGKWLQTCEPD